MSEHEEARRLALYKAEQERDDLGKRLKVVSDSLLAVKRDLVRAKLDARCNEIERESFERELERLRKIIARFDEEARLRKERVRGTDPDEVGYA